MLTRVLGDITLREDDTTLTLGNAALELALSKETGNWLELTSRPNQIVLAHGDGLAPTMLLRLGGRRTAPQQVRNSRMVDLVGDVTVGWRTHYVGRSVTCDVDSVTLDVVAREGDWLLTSHYVLKPEEAMIRRHFTIRFVGQGEILLRDVRLLVPGLQLGSGAAASDITVEAPCYATRAHMPLCEIPDGIWRGLDSRSGGDPNRVQHDVDVPGSRPGLLGLDSPTLGHSLLTWIEPQAEFGMVELERRGDDLSLVQWLFVADRFHHDHAIRAGAQTLALHPGPWENALAWFQTLYGPRGLESPQDRPAWVPEAAIYEVHVGAAPFLGGIEYAPYPQVDDLIGDLPRIADLGFNTIQLMPHWPYCGYTVADYYDIDNSYGAEAAVRELVRTAHAMGLRILFDVVLHGCVDQEIVRWDMQAYGERYDFIFGKWLKRAPARSRYRDEHPEWFMVGEDGETSRVYTWAFDAANPSWQEYVVQVLSYYVQDLGVDGFRFDAPTWNCMPNWDRDLPRRASASYYGAATLLKKARCALKALDEDVAMYTEPNGPLFRRNMDLNYNYDEEWLWASLVGVLEPDVYAGSSQWDGRRLTARELATWLHYRRLAVPAGSLTVHHLDSHDTFWWGEKARFRRDALGQDAARILFALCAFLDGGIMSYVGAEEGSEEFYRRVLHLRRDIPELRHGDCDYLGVICDEPMVLPLLRQYQGQYTLVLLNLSGYACAARMSLPTSPQGLVADQPYTVWDAWAGRLVQLGRLVPLETRMEPYGLQVWVIRQQTRRQDDRTCN
jgi:hypothetical protein